MVLKVSVAIKIAGGNKVVENSAFVKDPKRKRQITSTPKFLVYLLSGVVLSVNSSTCLNR